jgi:hypothetical protein
MKKAFSISLAFLVLLTIIHFSIAMHYCGGKLAAVKYSLTGEKATCGMEEKDEVPFPFNNSIRSHCCEDELTSYSITDYYLPASQLIHKVVQNYSSVNSGQFNKSLHSSLFNEDIKNSYNPPRNLPFADVKIDFLCTYRI